jgi:hypothetical protein
MRRPLNARITEAHYGKLDELRGAGLSLYAIIEQGIDAVYDRMAQAHLIGGTAQQDEEQVEQAAAS